MTTSSGDAVHRLHQSVRDALGRRIVSAQLPAGAILTLEGIQATYSVSRPIAREAVRVLQSMGLVATRRRVGITVLPRNEWNVFDPLVIRWRLDGDGRREQLLSLSELRRGFEPIAARLAAERAQPQHHGDLARAVGDMVVHAASGDLEAYLEADTAFHHVLLDACGNDMLAAFGDLVAELLAGRTHHHLMPATPNPAAIELHEKVAIAVRTGDPAGAEEAMRAIIDEAAEALESAPDDGGKA
ncbi:MAG: FadR/GntR family transcriptional regulator [Nocardioides sp.]|uniref:FadR/GntR family transcriptional regulator n=1 Tax=Nocardioides sp. TaxID=35761 RepID=UPI003D6B3845